MRPKEDPQAKADRERERRIAGIERRDATQKTAQDLAVDLRSTFGARLASLFNVGKKPQ